MELRQCFEANKHSCSRKIPEITRNALVHHPAYNMAPLDPTPIQSKPVQKLTPLPLLRRILTLCYHLELLF